MAYRVVTGLDYPPDKRAEAGDVVDDLPPKSVKWLLKQGLIEETDGGKKTFSPVVEPVDEPVEEPAAEPAPVTFEDGE